MLNVISNLLFSKDYIPHGHCYLWQSSLVWLHLLSDSLIALAYYSIPILLLYFIRQREDIPFKGIFVLFSAFIISCGTTHLIAVLTFWYPAYWVSGVLKAITAFISCYTAIELFPILPQALCLPSPTALKQINQQLVEQIKERGLAEAEKERTKNFLHTLVNYLPVALFVKDGKEEKFGQLLLVNTACEELFGLKASELIGKTAHDLFPKKQADFYEEKDREAFIGGVVEDIPSEPIDSYSKGHRIIHTIKVPLYDENRLPEYLLCISSDITEQKRASEALQQSEQRWKALIENATDLIFILDAQFRFCYLSPSAKRIFGYHTSQLIDQSFLTIIHPDERQLIVCLLEQARSNSEIIQRSFEYRLDSPYGSWRFFKASVKNLLNTPAVNGIVLNCYEITDIKQAEGKLLYDACHDSLTGLPNRTLFMDRLKQALNRQQRNPKQLFGVIFLDLDRFKIVNDSLGHLSGDQLLIALGNRLEKCKRPNDTLARLGGDEFVILLENLQNQDQAIKVAERIHEILKKPFVIKNQELFVSVSIGITFSSSYYYKEPAQLLRDADTAMYKAKACGKSCHVVFDVSMHNYALRQLRLESDLRRAIERQELVIYYQPIFSLENNYIQGMEALVRWQHPELGFIFPTDFIPLAEETGIIIALDEWVLKHACHQLCYWRNQFPAFSHLTLNVNLSGNQFLQSDLIEKIDKILTETGLDGQNLKLEITESVLIENSESIPKMFNQLKDKKIQVCLDDFGTGYSSLSYLNRFPLNVLKIDRSFVKNLGIKDSKSAIVRAIVVMARELNIKVIAEGVETAEQINFLQSLGCLEAQGYWFSHPLDTKAMTHLLESC